MGVEVVEVNLGILDLITGLVDGVRSEPLDGGGHLGVEGVLQGLALPLIDILNLGLILSVREGGAWRPVWTSLWRSNFVTFGSRAAVGEGKVDKRNVIT